MTWEAAAMSLLMFVQEGESVMIVTDTLSTTPDGQPFNFQTKAWPLAHMNMAMAITGTADVGCQWNYRIGRDAVAQHIGHLDGFATEILQEIHEGLEREHGPIGTTTVYHFGFVPGVTQPIRFTYRSTNGYASERVDVPGFGVKPPPQSFQLEQPGDLDGFIGLAQRIRAENDEGRTDEHIRIGGELHLLLLQDHASQVARIHRFSDYDEHWATMMRRLAEY